MYSIVAIKIEVFFTSLNNNGRQRKSLFTAQKMRFSIKNRQETADFVIFTGEILNGKLHSLCSV